MFPATCIMQLPCQSRVPLARTSSYPAKKKKAKSAVIIKRETLAALHFPSDELFEKFRRVLIDLHCLFEADKESRTLTIPGQHESQIKQAIKLLGEDYTIRLEDVV